VSRTAALERPPGFVYRRAAKKSPTAEYLLYCEAVPVAELAGRFGTPLYIYSATAIEERLRTFDRAFGKAPHTICYSVKANSNLSILRLLAGMGCGFDVVSSGELERVLQAAPRAAQKVVFSGVGKTADEMRMALKAGILLFNVESEAELGALAECAGRMKKSAPIALRVNPDVSAETHPYISTGLHQHKFGVPMQQALDLYRRAAKSEFLRVRGVSVHIGSQITDMKPFTASMERVAGLVKALREEGHKIEYVDAGGGLGIAYDASATESFLQRSRSYARALLRPLRSLKVHLLLEPGRSIVGPAGVLLTRVTYRKTNNGKNFVVVDAAMNDLLRPSLYKAYHEIVPVAANSGNASRLTADVVGPVCETGDFFARDRELPPVDQGDLLAILDAGAYGMSLASNYNTRGRPAEIMVKGKSAKLIRRRETIRDLLGNEMRGLKGALRRRM
jgi:diaminopimelate decarboxylase